MRHNCLMGWYASTYCRHKETLQAPNPQWANLTTKEFAATTKTCECLAWPAYIYFVPSKAENYSIDKLLPLLRNQKDNKCSWKQRHRWWSSLWWAQWKDNTSGLWLVLPQEGGLAWKEATGWIPLTWLHWGKISTFLHGQKLAWSMY